MKPHDERVCARARQLVSALLDGRLDARRRGALQRHLAACRACQQVVRDTERLARATHNLPQHRTDADLADRVRGALLERRGRRFETLHDGARRLGGWRGRSAVSLVVAAAAALLLLAGTWWLGYRAGPSSDEVGPRVGAEGASAPDEPPAEPGLSPRTPGAAFVANSTRVLRDLAWAHDLPATERRSLIAAQLELYDLQRRAEQVLDDRRADPATRELARLIRDLARLFREPDAAEPAPDERAPGGPVPGALLKREAGASFAAVPVDEQLLLDPAAAGQPIEPIVARHAARLEPHERDELSALLQLQREIASGQRDAGRTFVRRFSLHYEAHGSFSSSFSIATGMAGARRLHEAGLEQDAAELQRVLQAAMAGR